jgi:hypothetical protein
MTITPDEAEVLNDAINDALIDVHVSLPGRVQLYNPLTQTATIVLPIKRVLQRADDSFTTEALPVLENVPVAFMRSAAFALTLPLAPGDTGLVVFSEVSIDQWRSKNAETSPGDIGRHTLTGGVFYPGLAPNAKAINPLDTDISTDMVMGEIDGVQLRVKPGGIAHVVSGGNSTADDFVVMTGKLDSAIVAMLTAGEGFGGDAALNFAAALAEWEASQTITSSKIGSENLKADNKVVPP